MRHVRAVQIKMSSATVWTGSMTSLLFVSLTANCSKLLWQRSCPRNRWMFGGQSAWRRSGANYEQLQTRLSWDLVAIHVSYASSSSSRITPETSTVHDESLKYSGRRLIPNSRMSRVAESTSSIHGQSDRRQNDSIALTKHAIHGPVSRPMRAWKSASRQPQLWVIVVRR